MQIGIRLHDTLEADLEIRLKTIKAQGFECTHLALKKVFKDIKMENSALTPGFGMYLNRVFNKYEIDIAVLGCYLNLAHPDQDKLQTILETYKANIKLASILKVGVVGTETGAPNANYEESAMNHTPAALATLIENLRKVVSYASAFGVIMAIEPVYKHIVYNALVARQVLDTINSPNLQIIFDPVNLLSIDNVKNAQEVIREAMALLGKNIAVVHLKDYIVKNNEIMACACGEGEMDYVDILTFIKQEKPYMHVTLENTNPENAIYAREYIEKIYHNIV